jgi:hypothetical protein
MVAILIERFWRRRMLQGFNAMRLGRRGGSAGPLVKCLAGMRKDRLKNAFNTLQGAARQRTFEVEKAGHFKQF